MAKIVNGAGEIVEGVVISDEQLANRDRLASFFHSHFCGNDSHYPATSGVCQRVALKLAMRIGLTPEGKALLNSLTDEQVVKSQPVEMDTFDDSHLPGKER